jgi:hypothetical protein
LELREQWKSENVAGLVRWIDECLQSGIDNVIKQTNAAVRSASLREKKSLHWLKEQMPNGLELKTEAMSHCSTGLLDLFQVAMSLEAIASQTV